MVNINEYIVVSGWWSLGKLYGSSSWQLCQMLPHCITQEMMHHPGNDMWCCKKNNHLFSLRKGKNTAFTQIYSGVIEINGRVHPVAVDTLVSLTPEYLLLQGELGSLCQWHQSIYCYRVNLIDSRVSRDVPAAVIRAGLAWITRF